MDRRFARPHMSSAQWNKAKPDREVSRTNEAVIRSFPDRVLVVTVLRRSSRNGDLVGTGLPTRFSLDSCLAAETHEVGAKRSRLFDERHHSPASIRAIQVCNLDRNQCESSLPVGLPRRHRQLGPLK